MSAAVLHMRDEGNAIVRDIARRESAKILAFKAGISPRHVYNLREEIGQPDIAWPHFIAVAKHYPELRVKVMEWLDASIGENDKDPTQVLNEIQRLLSNRG